MPVLECSCGMVMSISTAAPRETCIRCGSVGLQPLKADARMRTLQRTRRQRAPNALEALLPLVVSEVVPEQMASC